MRRKEMGALATRHGSVDQAPPFARIKHWQEYKLCLVRCFRDGERIAQKEDLFHDNCEGYAAFVVVFQTQGAAVEADDWVRDDKTDARASGFGRKKWREDVFGDLAGDCRAIVGDLDPDALFHLGAN